MAINAIRVRFFIARAFAEYSLETDCPEYASTTLNRRLPRDGAESAESAQVLANFDDLANSAPSATMSVRPISCPGCPTSRKEIAVTTANDLRKKRCVSCESGVPALQAAQVRDLLGSVPDWKLAPDGKKIRREWKVKDFMEGMTFFHRVADIAETDDHHPDLHLTGYRNVAIELSTHAVGGLTENDFILAAKIDAVPVELKK